MAKKPPDPLHFWSELKRRKVVKASLVYLAVAFGILQAVEMVFPRLGLPDWTVTFILILLIIIFILVIVLTWVYDITPEGIKVTEDLGSRSEVEAGKKSVKGIRPTEFNTFYGSTFHDTLLLNLVLSRTGFFKLWAPRI